MNILQITCHFHPNIGGVETHLCDLVHALVNKGNKVFVLTYRPLSTNSSYKISESGKGYTIFRLPWISGFFYKLVKNPIAEFLYLIPGLFVVTPFVILFNNFNVIHAHGLVAGFVGVLWGKVFGKKVIISTHNIYQFPKNGLYRNFVNELFRRADTILTLSKQSKNEVETLGVDPSKVKVFTYWIDLNNFKPIKDAKSKVNWNSKFIVLFVGRLIKEKGILELLESAKKWNKKIFLAIAGDGPLANDVMSAKEKNKNIIFLGKIDQQKLPIYYSASDILIVPSMHEEGFGRVILEALACGTPVIGSNRGAIPEAMDETVGKLINVSPDNITIEVESLYKHPEKLVKFSKNGRNFALRRYSKRNVGSILDAYE